MIENKCLGETGQSVVFQAIEKMITHFRLIKYEI